VPEFDTRAASWNSTSTSIRHGRNLPNTYSYSDPITFTVPDAADEYAFEIPVPGTNQVVTIDSQTTTFPA